MARPATHPGEVLSEELETLGVTATELARQLKVPANRITQIVAGKRGVTGDTAAKGVESFTVTGDFKDSDVFDALQKAGLTGTVGQ